MEVTVFHLMPYPEVENAVAWPFSEDEFDPEVGQELYRTYLDQLEYCEELGYDAIGFNEHHFNAYGLMPSPNLIASNLATRTDEITLAPYGNVLPIRGHPIRLAEELAMLDNISGGRIRSGFVRGIPSEYAAYNVDPNESRARFKEAWDLVVQAWTAEEPFDFDGEFFQYDDVYIWPRPVQDPHPPLWMPAESEQSIRFAAERQIPMARIYIDSESIARTFEEYRRIASEEFGWTPTDDFFEPARAIYVAEDMETAREEAEEHLDFFYDKLYAPLYRAGAVQMVGDSEYREENAFEYEEAAPDKGSRAMNFDFDWFQEEGEIIVGDPEYVVEQIEHQYDLMGGFGNLIGLFHFGTLPDDLMRKSLELFADEVMPEIRSLGPETRTYEH